MNACSTHKPAPPLNSNLPFCQLLNERNISFEKIVIQHFLPRRPTNVAENSILDFARIALHQIEVQLDSVAILVPMTNGRHLRPNRGANPKFLFQLPTERVFRPFLRLNLAAGEFPLQRHRLMPRPLADENLVSVDNEGRHNLLHEISLWPLALSPWLLALGS